MNSERAVIYILAAYQVLKVLFIWIPHNTRRFAIQYLPLDLILGVSLLVLAHRLCKYHYVLSNVNLGQPLFVPLEIHGDIVLGDTPAIVIAVVGDTETQILEDRYAKDVSDTTDIDPCCNNTIVPHPVFLGGHCIGMT